jgi:P27 family predicted phage terminase small subunit
MANTTGAGGRPRKPARLKLLQGNAGHRPIGTEPDPTPAADVTAPPPPPDRLPYGLEPPDFLDEYGRQLWAELAPELSRLKLLTVLDRPILAAACEQWSVYRRAAKSTTLRNRSKANGYTADPRIAIARQALAQCRQLLAELGVTAAARARLGVTDAEKPSDPAQDFLNSKPKEIQRS